MGTVLLTGFVMMVMKAVGQNLATPKSRSAMMLALVLKRSGKEL